MSGEQLLTALGLPAGCRLDQRVPKKLLLENGAPTAADRRLINEAVGELLWVAALKPTTVGVPAYSDDEREYLEIAVLHVTVRGAPKVQRLVELVHRAIPYPLLLFTGAGVRTEMSAAHKRWSQNELGKTVLDGDLVSVEWDASHDSERWEAFTRALALGSQPRMTLYALYQGWIDTLVALQAARLTGVFTRPTSQEQGAEQRNALRECVRLDAEIARLRGAAGERDSNGPASGTESRTTAHAGGPGCCPRQTVKDEDGWRD